MALYASGISEICTLGLELMHQVICKLCVDGTGRSKIKNIRKWYVRKKPAKSRGRKIGEDTQSRYECTYIRTYSMYARRCVLYSGE